MAALYSFFRQSQTPPPYTPVSRHFGQLTISSSQSGPWPSCASSARRRCCSARFSSCSFPSFSVSPESVRRTTSIICERSLSSHARSSGKRA